MSSFQMVESSAYFEAYKHVLKKLQDMDSWVNMPLSDYYVYGKSDLKIPAYVQDILAYRKPELV